MKVSIKFDDGTQKEVTYEPNPELRRNMLLGSFSRDCLEAIAAGADGYLLKEDADKDLFAAIDTVLEGKIYISRFLAEESWKDWAEMHRF
jgi:DNA-binding NarL/FixJ family response regulator